MKKVLLLLLVFCLFVTGCEKNNSKDILKELEKKMNQSNGYLLTGTLSVHNNDEVYHYKVESLYQKDDKYRITLTNEANDHTQVILKNSDGVYVLTPSLNKSFRFQSEWPYNHSQIYLLDALIKDLEEDSQKEMEKKKDNYVFQVKCNYPTNAKLMTQKIVISKDYKPIKISVFDKDGVEAMSMDFENVQYSPKISKDAFDIDTIMDTNMETEVKETSSLEDIVYPLFVPSGTKLVGEEKIEKTNGERVIMNYDGEKSFLLVEETADVFQEFTVIPTSGEPYFLMDTLGVMTDNSLSWTSGGVEYYLVSDVMSSEELVQVAQSIGGIVSMK